MKLSLYIFFFILFCSHFIFYLQDDSRSLKICRNRKSYVLQENKNKLKREAKSKATEAAISASITESIKMLLEDVYKILFKKKLKLAVKHIETVHLRKRIRKHMDAWWTLIFHRLRGTHKISSYARNKLKRCFYSTGVEAYKKTVVDIHDSPGEFFFLVLMEFKNTCLLNEYGPNSFVYARFQQIEEDMNFLHIASNIQKILAEKKRKYKANSKVVKKVPNKKISKERRNN